MRNLKLLILLAMFSGQPVFAFANAVADPVREQQIRASQIELFELLSRNQVERIGNLPLAEVLKNMQSVNYKFVDAGLLTQGRPGHRYDVPTKTVYISRDVMDKLELVIPKKIENMVVLTHEALGAAGYFDEKYEISSVLTALAMLIESNGGSARSKFAAVAASLRMRTELRTVNPTSKMTPVDSRKYLDSYGQIVMARYDGGVSEGGGGGDPVGAYAKAVILAELLQESQKLSLINFLINGVDLESFMERDRRSVSCSIDPRDFKDSVVIEKRQNAFTISFANSCLFHGAYINYLKSVIKKLQ